MDLHTRPSSPLHVAAWSRADRLVAVLLGTLLAGLFLATADRGPAQVNDTRAVAVASWSLATTGSASLPESWPASGNYWGTTGRDGQVFVNRFPGVAYIATPAYLLDRAITGGDRPAHPLLVDPAPARHTAALLAAAAGAAFFVLFRQVVARRVALAGAAAVALGTSLWSVAASAPWPHAPAMLAIATCLWGWRTSRPVLAAVCGALAVTVRPHVAVALLLLASFAWRREGWRPATALAGGGTVGLLATSAYSAWAFGTWLPVAGYDAAAHLGGLASRSPGWTFAELWAAFVAPERGLLIASPWVAFALIALIWRWRHIPTWTQVAALTGLAVLVVQVRVAGHAGGDQLASYRVSLEALAFAAPALIAAAATMRRTRLHLALAAVGVAASVGLHATAATAGGIEATTTARWEQLDANLHDRFGHLDLGEVDLTQPPNDDRNSDVRKPGSGPLEPATVSTRPLHPPLQAASAPRATRSMARRAGGRTGCSVATGEVVGDGVGGVAVQRMSGAVVASGGLGVGVAGEVLHVAQRHARIQAHGDRGVPQAMRGEVHRDGSVTSERGHEVLHVVGGHATPCPVHQQRAVVATVDGEGDRLHGRWRERDDGGPITFGGGQLQGVVPRVVADVLDVASDQLPAPQAVQPEQHRGRPPRAAAGLGCGQPVGELVAGQARGRRLRRTSWAADQLHGVTNDQLFAHAPAVERRDG